MKKNFRKKWLSLALSLAVALTLVGGSGLTAHAEEDSAAGSEATAEEDADINDSGADVELTGAGAAVAGTEVDVDLNDAAAAAGTEVDEGFDDAGEAAAGDESFGVSERPDAQPAGASGCGEEDITLHSADVAAATNVEMAAETGGTGYAASSPSVVVDNGSGEKKEFDSLKEALESVPADGTAATVSLLADINEDGAIAEGQDITLDLSGHVLAGTGDGSVLTVRGSLTLEDRSEGALLSEIEETAGILIPVGTDDGADTEQAGMVTGGTGTFSGSGNEACGGGVYVADGAGFVMEGGSVTGNSLTISRELTDITACGGGVYVGDGGSFEMNGGSVSGNTVDLATTGENVNSINQICVYGGGVYVGDGGSFAMGGGSISDNESIGNGDSYTSYYTYGDGVYVGDGSSVTMSGGSISDNTGTRVGINRGRGRGGGLYAGEGSSFEMTGGVISGNDVGMPSWSYGGGIYLDVGSSFSLNGGRITGNAGNYGGGVRISSRGIFVMDGGTIADNGASNNEEGVGGGVFVSGEFTMNGGSITGNKEYSAGGLYMSGTFVMNGGEITDNVSFSGYGFTSGGGGVDLDYGDFTMNDGLIAGNRDGTGDTPSYTRAGGGGVYMYYSTFRMNGGTITENAANRNGGGVCIGDRSDFEMGGGSITENEAGLAGGGVYLNNVGTTTFTVGGAPTVTGNALTDGTENNVHLQTGAYIILAEGGLSDGASIGVTTEEVPNEDYYTQVTKMESDTEYYKDAVIYFFSDLPQYYVRTDDTNRDLCLWPVTESYDVYFDISHLRVVSGSDTSPLGADYWAQLAAEDHYLLPEHITVTVRGREFVEGRDYSWDPQSGMLDVYAVNIDGNIVVTAEGVPETFDVNTDGLSHITSDGEDTAIFGEDYHTVLTPDEGYLLPQEITVTVGEGDGMSTLTEGTGYFYDPENGELTVYEGSVTGTISISAAGVPMVVEVSVRNLEGITLAEGGGTATVGEDYEGRLVAAEGYSLPEDITVTSGGHELTADDDYVYDPDRGTLSIRGDSIRGDIVVSEKHEHEYVETGREEPTCTQDGWIAYTCIICGQTAYEPIAATGHIPATDPAVEPTCTQDGLTAGSHCSVCGLILIEQEPIPATGHTPVVDPAVEPTCTQDGLTAGTHCSVCHEVLIAPEVVPALGHEWDGGIVVKEATADEDGEIVYTCMRCGEEKTEAIPATGDPGNHGGNGGDGGDGNGGNGGNGGTESKADTLCVRRGAVYYFSYTIHAGDADLETVYGHADDTVLFGDWDGDGVDTYCVRRGAEYYFRNSLTSGNADEVIVYGRADDDVLVGDWDGDGKDTLAVRRGRVYYLANSIKSGSADQEIVYGRETDDVIVGDWDGDGKDTPAVRRGAQYFFQNTFTGGEAEYDVVYGHADDVVLVGDWDGDGKDTLAVRRGAEYYFKNSISAGDADEVVVYGRADDEVYAGKWR